MIHKKEVIKLTYNEEVRDLFSVPDDYYFCHCISADIAMGLGIATEFNKRFNMKNILKSKYGTFVNLWDLGKEGKRGFSVLEGRTFNLITKRNGYMKPTYSDLGYALVSMRETAIKRNIGKIAMPLIGCGLDRLKWDKVSVLIQKVFEKTDIEILVCKL